MFADGPQDGETDGVISADAQGTRARCKDRSQAAFDAGKGVFDAERIDRQVAEIRGAMLFKWIDSQHGVPRADDRGLSAHSPRSEARARPIRSAAIERHTDDRDVELFRLRDVRQ